MEEEVDEYRIRPILEEYRNEAQDDLFEALTLHLDKVLGTYLETSEDIRKSAFTEMYCHLAQVLISCEDDAELLKEGIETVMAGCLNYEEK
tara:strand:- start:6945 stop:7217 length:273 start_codon:yes stop_codon:yes gene_type:complete